MPEAVIIAPPSWADATAHRKHERTGWHMAGTKPLGIDGPPQLVGRSRRASSDELLDGFRQTQEPTSADRSDAQRTRGLSQCAPRPIRDAYGCSQEAGQIRRNAAP